MNAKILIKKIKTFTQEMDNKRKVDFIKAYIYTAISRIYILFIPFNKLRKKMGKSNTESPKEINKELYTIARNIRETVLITSRNTPWKSKCLVQALTAQKLLKEKGISTTLYLGVGKDRNNNMLAHAWLRCGEYYVTGGENREGYAVVAKFAN